jgi:cytidylate kinase
MIPSPKLRFVTFDGEARSGKGTIVQATKDYLRDHHGYKVMLVDLGQVFRVLVVAVTQAGVDMNDPAAIDAFLADPIQSKKSVQLVKDVYRMSKSERDGLLYTNEVGAGSAQVGARPLSQSFKDELLKKWLYDAALEGYDVVLLDGRALEETGTMLEREGLGRFVAGLYFICDAKVGARRTLGFAMTPYDRLSETDKHEVDALVEQIYDRNQKDHDRKVQPVVPPLGAPTWVLPDMAPQALQPRPMMIIDTSDDMTKQQMSQPVAEFVADVLA